MWLIFVVTILAQSTKSIVNTNFTEEVLVDKNSKSQNFFDRTGDIMKDLTKKVYVPKNSALNSPLNLVIHVR